MTLTGAPALRASPAATGSEYHGELGPEAATDLHGYGLDAGDRDAHEAGSVVADGEVSLTGGPDGEGAVLVPHGGAAVRLDIALVDGDCGGLLLDDDVGFLESGFGVTEAELEVVSDVGAARSVVVVKNAAGADVGGVHGGEAFVDQRGVFLHGIRSVQNGGEDLVFDVNQGKSLLGDMGAGRSDGCDGMSLVEGLFLGEDVVAEELVVDHRALGEVGGAAGGLEEVCAGNDSADAGMGLGAAGVQFLDAGVGVGAAEDLPVEHARQVDISRVAGLSGHFVSTVGTDGTGANDVVFFVGQDYVRLVVQHVFLHRLDQENRGNRSGPIISYPPWN